MYTGASAMMAQQLRTDVLANNLANVNTVGFKKERLVQAAFPEMMLRRLYDPVGPRGGDGTFYGEGHYDPRPVIGRLGTGTYVEGTWTVHSDGPLQWTSNPLDVALVGEGFIAVDTEEGPALTRDGRLSLAQDGTLVIRGGLPVMGEEGPIVIAGENVVIDEGGFVHVDGEVVGRLLLVAVDNPQTLRKVGEGLWLPTEETGPFQEATATVHAGYVEQSNVNTVTSMVQLISAFRAYEASQKVIQAYDETLGKVVNDLGRG